MALGQEVSVSVWDDPWTWGRVCLNMTVSHHVPPFHNYIHSLFIGEVFGVSRCNV